MKPIYVIYTLDNGILGVFGNLLKAHKVASVYCKYSIDSPTPKTYSKLCREIKGSVNYPVYISEVAGISITCYELNREDY